MVGKEEKGQVREWWWRHTQPDNLRNLLGEEQGDFSELRGREMKKKGTKSYLLVIIHIGDLCAVPLLKGVRGLHWPVNVVNAIGFVIVSGACKKLLIFFREGKGGRKRRRETSMWEKHWLVASRVCLDWGLNLQPRYVPEPGIKLTNFSFAGWHPTNWATPGRASLHIFTYQIFNIHT